MVKIISKEESQIISIIKGILTLFVIFIHTDLAPDTRCMENAYTIFYKYFYHLLCIANPLFFLISGFLFFSNQRFGIDTYKKKIVRRLHTLVIPYFVWNTIYLIIFAIGCYIVPSLVGSINVNVLTMNTSEILESYFSIYGSGLDVYPIDSPLWFVRNLFMVSLLSPLFFIICRLGRWSVLLLFLLQLSFMPLGNMIVWTVVYFYLGAYLVINNVDIIALVMNYGKKSFFVFIIFVLVSECMELSLIVYGVLNVLENITGMTAIVYFAIKLKCVCNVEKLGNIHGVQFLIFAMHGIIARTLTKVMAIFTLNYRISPILFFLIQIIDVVIIISICIFSYYLLQFADKRIQAILGVSRYKGIMK